MSKVTDALSRAEQEREILVASANGPHGRSNGSIGSTGAAVTPSLSQPVAAAPQASATPETVEQAIAVIERKLSEVEQDAARQAGERMRVQAQFTASERLLTQLEQERKAFQQRLAQIDHAAAELETSKGTWVKQLSALRDCQVLSHELQMAERSLQAGRTLIEHTTQSQRQVAAELAQQTQQQTLLQQRVDALKFQLGNALALTGTTKTMRSA